MASFMALAPLVAVVAGALAVLLLEAFLKRKDSELPAYTAVAALIAAGFFTVRSWDLGLVLFRRPALSRCPGSRAHGAHSP